MTAAYAAVATDEAAAIAPINLTTSAGAATITNPNSTTTKVVQASDRAIYSSTNLNAPAGYTLQIVAPSTTSISLINVNGGKTTFLGNLTANDNVWIINSNGMLFNGAHVNVSGLLFSTAGISNASTTGFMTNTTGSYNFDQAGSPTASITIENSSITATGNPTIGGNIILQAPQVTVTNSSTLTSNNGAAALAGGQTFTADFFGDGLINFQVVNTAINAKVAGSTSSVEVSNGSTIKSGKVIVTATINQDDVLDHVINLGGQFEVGTYNKTTNPQHVSITNKLTVTETVIPSIHTTSTVTPPTTTSLDNFAPLIRSFSSLGDDAGHNNPNPAGTNTYEKPYTVSQQNSLDSGNFNLLAPAGGNTPANPVNFGNLSPSAGGNMTGNGQTFGNLSPSAGGTTNGINGSACANAFLGSSWLSDPHGAQCAN